MIMKTSNSISNDCPTQDNIINCSECDLECKLRMAAKITLEERYKQTEEYYKKFFYLEKDLQTEVSPEPPAVIYF